MSTIAQTAIQQPKPSPEDWDYQFVESLARGLDFSSRSDRIEDSRALQADNIRFEDEEVRVDLGYKKFGQQVRGNPRAAYQFFLKNGSSFLTLITNATFYVWSETALEWQYVSDGTSTTLSATANQNDTSITVASAAGFSDGDLIGIKLDSGKQHQTTVNGAPVGSVITLTDAMPEVASSGNAVVKGVALNGTDDVGVSITTWAAFDKMYFANGADAPKQFDGVTCTNINNLPGTNFSCRVITIFNNFLIMMHTVEDGTAFPQRVRWSEPGVDDNFNELVNFVDLYEGEDWIVATESLGPFQIIYKERSIVRMEFVGTLEKTFSFFKTIEAEGALSQDSVVNLGDSHIIIGNANVYEYKGGFSIDPIGDEIFDIIFGVNGNVNPQFSQRSFAFYVEEKDEIWAFFAFGSDQFPKDMIKMQVATRAWSQRSFTPDITGFGFYQSQGDLTWNDLVGTWEALTFPWVGKQTKANAPTTLLCSSSAKQVYEYDYVTSNDDGAAISYVFVTKDFYVPNRDLRFNRFDFELKGSNVLVEYSTDKGTTWKTLATFSPGAAYAVVKKFKQFVARRVRFRFSGNGGFGLRWLGFEFKRESLA